MGKGNVPYPVQPAENPTIEQISSTTSYSGVVYPMLDPTAPSAPPPPYNDITPHQQLGPTTVQPSYQHTTVVMSQVQQPMIFPKEPINIQCWYCHRNIRTRTKGHSTCLSWLLCGLLCGIGCCCGCCLIPFCTNGSRDIIHSCPKCGKYLGCKQRER